MSQIVRLGDVETARRHAATDFVACNVSYDNPRRRGALRRVPLSIRQAMNTHTHTHTHRIRAPPKWPRCVQGVWRPTFSSRSDCRSIYEASTSHVALTRETLAISTAAWVVPILTRSLAHRTHAIRLSPAREYSSAPSDRARGDI